MPLRALLSWLHRRRCRVCRGLPETLTLIERPQSFYQRAIDPSWWTVLFKLELLFANQGGAKTFITSNRFTLEDRSNTPLVGMGCLFPSTDIAGRQGWLPVKVLPGTPLRSITWSMSRALSRGRSGPTPTADEW